MDKGGRRKKPPPLNWGAKMKIKTITPVTTEPVTLAEAKTHIRLTSGTFAGDVNTQQSITPGNHEVAVYTGTAIDVLGYITIVNLNSGTCAGTVTAKIQESDDNVSWQDFSSFAVVTATNDNAVQEIEYTGGKQYVRAVATVATASCAFSVDVVTKTGDTTEDDLITALITAAREYCEGYTGRALATQTLEAYPPYFPRKDEIEIPYPPLQSVTSVKYKNSAGAETTMVVDTDYIIDADSNVGRIVLPYAKTWPTATLYTVNPIKIRYVAGYYEANPIPKMIKQAMLLLIGHWYENREALLVGQGTMSKKIEFAVDALLSMYRARWF
jgi:uncharacterized phiE125 gp8 family phage protein